MTSTVARRARFRAAHLAERVPSPVRPLADPPPGSGLKPVMGDQGLPLIGHSLAMLADQLAFARRRYERFGPVQWGGFFGTRGVLVMGPDAVGEVLSNRDKAFANQPGWEYFIGPFFHRGLMLLDFEEHLHHKRIMQEAFTRDRLHGYLGRMNVGIDRGLSEWRPGEGFRVYDATKQLLLDLATEVFVGAELGAEADRLSEAFVDTVAAGLSVVRADVPGGNWHRGVRGRRVLEEYFRRQLPAKRAGDGDDLFSVLCRARTEDGHAFSDDDIVNHMIFVLMAAHDTSTITTATVAYYLAANPQWQDRVRAESQALGKPTIDYDDLDRLPLLDRVFKEALRLNPPVGGIVRQTVKDTSVLGHYLPAGTKVLVGILPTHRVDPWWSDPDTFDPDRFADDRREDRSHRYAWTPFGGGAHKCIGLYFGGMQVKAIMHQLLLKYSWSVPDGYEPPMEYGTGLYPADGLPVHLKPLGR